MLEGGCAKRLASSKLLANGTQRCIPVLQYTGEVKLMLERGTLSDPCSKRCHKMSSEWGEEVSCDLRRLAISV